MYRNSFGAHLAQLPPDGFSFYRVEPLDHQTTRERNYRLSHVARATRIPEGYMAEVWSHYLRNGIGFRTKPLARLSVHQTPQAAIAQASRAMRHPRFSEYVQTRMRQRPATSTKARQVKVCAANARKFEQLKEELGI